MEIKFHCRGDGENLTIVVFSPRNYILYFQTMISGRVDDYCSVLYLDKSKFSLHWGDKASTYSYWIVYISMSFIGDSYAHNVVHEIVITLVPIYTKEFVCTVWSTEGTLADLSSPEKREDEPCKDPVGTPKFLELSALLILWQVWCTHGPFRSKCLIVSFTMI